MADGTDFLGSWLIDPLDGLSDLQARRLKAVDDQVFRHDPLRMLRAVRLMTRYQLQIDPWTASLITRDAQLLPEVAWERIHDELYAILGPDGATTQLHFLDEHNLFITIFPEFLPARGMRQPRPHHWDVLTHSIETVGALERIAQLVQDEPIPAPDPVGAPFMDARQGGEDESTNIDHGRDIILTPGSRAARHLFLCGLNRASNEDGSPATRHRQTCDLFLRRGGRNPFL